MATAAQNPLGLRIPEQGAPKEGVLLRPKEVEDWIQHLPVASATKTARQLLHAIQDMNRAHMPPQTRVQLAELLGSPIVAVIDSLESRFTGASFPLTEKSLRTAHACVRMYEELGYAYKIAAHDVAMGRIGQAERKLLVIALFRSVRHLADLVYQNALVYDPFPVHVWRELHNLFVFAETNKWSSTKIKLKGHDESDAQISTLRESYLEVLLFAAANPYQLRQREIRALTRHLGEWATLPKIVGFTGQSGSDSRFVVQLKLDRPALHASLVDGEVEKPALEFDTGPLVRALHELADSLPQDTGTRNPGDRQEDIDRHLLQRLTQAWGGAPVRQYVRTRLNFDLDIAVGLSNVCTLISGEDDTGRADDGFGAETEDDGMEVSEINAESTFSSDLLETESGFTLVPMDSRDGVYINGGNSFGPVTQKEAGPPPSIWTARQESKAELSTTTTLRTLNESAGGYCVHWNAQKVPGVQIGELVGIQSPGNQASYGLATVRWMQNRPDEGLQVGLQLLASNALTVNVTEAQRHRRTTARCLMVPELKSAQRPASLIMPTLGFEVGMSLLAWRGETEQRLKLVRLLECTGAFSQFEFRYE